MRRPDLVIFDMDGLMFDTERLFMNFLIATAKEYGYTFTPELYLQTIGTSGDNLKRIVYAALGDTYPHLEISRKAQRKLFEYMATDTLPIKPGLISLLDYLNMVNIPCCVASSTKTEYVQSYITNARLTSYFSYIIGGDKVTCTKPSPEIFLKACEHFSTLPNRALVLEDSKNGILASFSGGIPVICVPDLIHPDNQMLDKSLAIVSSLLKVKELLE